MKYKINIKLKIILGIIILGLVAVIFYQSYAIFKESRKLRFIWGVVEDFEQTPDIVINVFVDGEKQEKFPNKENYAFKEMSCTNSGNAEFDEDKWQMSIKNITEPTECNIYFEEKIPELKVNIYVDDILATDYPSKTTHQLKELSCSISDVASWNDSTWGIDVNNLTENTECTIKFVRFLTDLEKYGTSIPSPIVINGCSVNIYVKRGTLHTSLSKLTSAPFYSVGNCDRLDQFTYVSSEWYPLNTIQTPNNSSSFIFQGLNTYSFTQSPLNEWIEVGILGGGAGGGLNFTGFKLRFADGSILNIQSAVNQKYIQPLVLYGSPYRGANETYTWPITESVLTTGDSGGTAAYAYFYVIFKVTNKSPLNGIQLNANKNFSQTYDGYRVLVLPDIDLSLIPFP